MSSSEILIWLQWVATVVSGFAGWFAGRYGRKSNSLQKMQDTIDMLVVKNTELYNQVTALRAENAQLKAGQERISRENAELKTELAAIRKKK